MALRKLSPACVAALLSFSAFAATVHPALPEVKRVYLLPMSSGLDQYLANRLTQVGRFEVVTDPASADAVFTDRIGPAFEDKWTELYPPPPPPVVEERVAADKADNKADAKPEDVAAPPLTRISSFSRGRGNVFLVSRKTGSVVWSHFTTPKDSRAKSLDSMADRIADRLHSDLGVKQ